MHAPMNHTSSPSFYRDPVWEYPTANFSVFIQILPKFQVLAIKVHLALPASTIHAHPLGDESPRTPWVTNHSAHFLIIFLSAFSLVQLLRHLYAHGRWDAA